LSEDVWGEVPRYQYLKYQEDLKREKEAQKQKRDRVRATLDEQVKARQASKMAHQDRAREVDARILAKAKAELDEEKNKKDVLKEKTLNQKAERDRQLRAAKQRRDAEYQDQRLKERGEVERLQAAIEGERAERRAKKARAREAAWVVIRENEVEKEKRQLAKEADQQDQIKITAEYNKMLDKQEKNRADEWAKREARIQNAMGRMADTVLKKSNA